MTALCPGLPGWAGTRKVKTNLDFSEARDSEWQWHQLGRMQVCTSLQKDNHASTPLIFFYRPDALPAAQPTASKHWRQKHCYHLYLYKYSIIPSLFHSFSANPSHRSLPFLLQEWLEGFAGLFTDTSEHIRFLLLSFSVFPLFSCWFHAID